MKEMDGFVRTYQVFDGGEEYRIDVQMIDVDEPTESYEAWIYTPSMGVKLFMFGMPTRQQGFDEFLEFVKEEWEDYIKDYKKLSTTQWR